MGIEGLRDALGETWREVETDIWLYPARKLAIVLWDKYPFKWTVVSAEDAHEAENGPDFSFERNSWIPYNSLNSERHVVLKRGRTFFDTVEEAKAAVKEHLEKHGRFPDG